MPIRSTLPFSAGPPTLHFVTALAPAISNARFRPYLRAADNDEETAIRLYLWNIAMAQSLFFPLQTAEVLLRNAVQRVLTAKFGEKWWTSGPRAICDPVQHAIKVYRNELERSGMTPQIEELDRDGPHPDRVVTLVTFSYWTKFFEKDQFKIIWDVTPALDPLRLAFPHCADTIENVGATVSHVLSLRNRLFHHEPLIGRKLAEDYEWILRLIGWVCPTTQEWVEERASVTGMMDQRPLRPDQRMLGSI